MKSKGHSVEVSDRNRVLESRVKAILVIKWQKNLVSVPWLWNTECDCFWEHGFLYLDFKGCCRRPGCPGRALPDTAESPLGQCLMKAAGIGPPPRSQNYRATSVPAWDSNSWELLSLRKSQGQGCLSPWRPDPHTNVPRKQDMKSKIIR